MVSKESQRVFVASKNHATTSIVFDLAHRSLRAADIQINRIWNHPPIQTNDPNAAAAFQDILIDVHFYFIALADVYKFLRKVVADGTFKELSPELASLNDKWCKHYSGGRDVFEHIDQRLPGQKHENQIREIEENGLKRKTNFRIIRSKGLFMHSDLEWDISKAKFESIRADVDEFLSLIVGIAEANIKA